MYFTIEIDKHLMDEAAKYSRLSDRKEIVHEALRVLIQREKQKRIRNYRGKLRWDGNLCELRKGSGC